ncbi:3-hydroxyanthranilic acid dioxygenase [Pilobolus umbonatus]|nr:3-hydroxyanthranilic acid dioxygenase [Pilobolus umbonatus]
MLPPINLKKWIQDNQDKLQPPVNNFLLYKGNDTIVMIVGGPNKRTDYHINETEEWFHQHKGSMLLKVVEDGVFKDIHIHEGDMFLLPANVPHNPVRYENTIGIVIERVRLPHHIDSLRWYCDGCHAIVYEESFHCTDLGTQLKPIITKFAANQVLRTCKKCGFVNSAK